MKNKSDYQNIPQTGFRLISSVQETKVAVTTFRVSGIIELAKFSLVQVLEGIRVSQFAVIDVNLKSLIFRLIDLIFMNPQTDTLQGIEITRAEVEQLVSYLKERLNHCEKERDEKSIKFNADTYIAQKMLLLELKDWLSGEITTIEN